MAGWTLVPCLVQLRSEFNAIAPGRDKASDGSIGDTAHSATVSDHNPAPDGQVHAIDVDVDLRCGVTMEDVVQFLLARCRSGDEKRLKYVIYNRRIWSASSGWVQKAYTGANAHDHHAHFSASYTPAHEASTAPWHLTDLIEGDDMLIKQGDSGEDVRFWQQILVDVGYPVEIDGDYGPKTAAAIAKFRTDRNATTQYAYLTGWTAYAMLREMIDRRVAPSA